MLSSKTSGVVEASSDLHVVQEAFQPVVCNIRFYVAVSTLDVAPTLRERLRRVADDPHTPGLGLEATIKVRASSLAELGTSLQALTRKCVD